MPRGSGSNGNLRDVKLVVTDESGKEHTFTATDWPDNNKPKDIQFGKAIKAKKIVLTGTKSYGDGGDKYQAAAELIFSRPQATETALDLSGYETALAKAQKLTSKENQEEVASVVASMKYATDNHLLTERMVAYFAEYLNQLQDQTVKPDAPTSSKGEEAAPILEVPEYKDPLGTAGEEAPTLATQPEFNGGVNAVEALVNEKPAYTGLLATAGDQAAPTIEKPEYQISQLGQGKLAESKTSVPTEDQKRLPETGESQSDTAIFLASVGLALSAAVLATKRKEN